MRGSIEGSLWALVLSGAGLSLASLASVSPMPGDAPATPQLEAPQPFQDSPTAGDFSFFAPEPESTFTQAAPRVSAPASQNTAPVLDPTPAAPPLAAKVEPDLVAPESTAEPALTSDADAPVLPSFLVEAPTPPADDAAVSVDTAPAVADVTEPEVAVEPEVIVEAAPEPEPEAPAVVVEETAEEPAFLAPAEDESAAAPVEDVQEQTAQVVEDSVVAETPPEPVVVEEVEEPTVAEAPQEPVVAQEAPVEADAPEDEPVVTQAPEETVVAEAAPAEQIAPTVRVNRPTEDVAEPVEEDAAVAEADAIPDDAPALLRFAATFENADDAPLISVMLIDDGSMADAAAAIADLGFAPTIAVNASLEGASTKMADYRAAGAEIAMQITLPVGAQPVDVEVAFEAAFGLLPQAAMLFSDGDGVLVDDRNVTAQAMQILKDDGLGFVAVQQGFGGAIREAEQAEVAAAAVAREIDGNGADQRGIVRTLDQAAFRARQSGGAVLLGRVTPDTLAALKDWAAELDTTQLRIAPVSAILLGGAE